MIQPYNASLTLGAHSRRVGVRVNLPIRKFEKAMPFERNETTIRQYEK